ncbi:hypothetical protein [Micropruina sonneratiae]|uniref:hypothetical protein n=1 Tax=Micropruina sonneratiae TaxID=2986940 RepID=UPI002227829D|nr:hypothetical protein [Micropruina sp. KQZ13P-5]MCW3159619.1 hypothetical protein [Micropruina sp. KQZ13P-5]
MTVGGGFAGSGAFMAQSTDQLRKDNALGDFALSAEEEQIRVIQAPTAEQAAERAKEQKTDS